MDLKTSHARTPSQIALDKATQSVQYKINTVEWTTALGGNTQNEWYHKNYDEGTSGAVASGLVTAEPLLFDFTSKSATTAADAIIPYECVIKDCQIVGVQQGSNPGDRSCEMFIGYVTYTPGVNVLSTASLMQSLGTDTVVLEDGWNITAKNLNFNGKTIPKNSMLFLLIRTTSSGPTNNCTVKLRLDLERKVCSCA